MTIQSFLHMGGYASYVWSSYAIVFTVLIGLILVNYRQFKSVFKNQISQ